MYDVTIWLDDFPKIKEKIEKLHKDNEQFYEYESKLMDQYKITLDSDLLLGNKKDQIIVLDEEIRNLAAKRNVIQEECILIEQSHKAPLKNILDTKVKELDNKFGIRVQRNF